MKHLIERKPPRAKHLSGKRGQKQVDFNEREKLKSMKNFDVAIIGGAYSGLAFANILAAAGLKVALIEKRSLIYKKQEGEPSRLLAISDISVDILQRAGMKNMSEIGQEIKHIFVCDDDSSGELEFDPKDVQMQNFGFMVEEHDLLHALYNAKNKGVTLYENTEDFDINATETGVELKLHNSDAIFCNLLVGADGKNSKVREHFYIETLDHDYAQTAFVFDIKHAEKHQGLAVEKFKPNGPVALLPKKTGDESCVVWTVPSNLVASIKGLSRAEVEELLAEDVADFFGEFKIISAIKGFPLMLRQAKEYSAQNTALIGDALHAIHPLAGQGLNLGLRDVNTLADLIITNKKLGLAINSSVMLDKYKSERMGDVTAMIQGTHCLNILFSNNFMPLRVARRIGLKIVDKFKPLKSLFMRYAVGSMEFQNRGKS